MEKSAEFKKEICVKWLADIGASTSDSKQERTMRINRLSRYPGLVQKLKAKSEKAYVFPCTGHNQVEGSCFSGRHRTINLHSRHESLSHIK